MAAPTVKWYLNTATEGSPTWTEVSATDAYYFAGPDTTGSSLDPVQAPTSGTKFPEEFWKAQSAAYASGVQCTNYEQDITSAVNTNIVAVQFDDNPTSTAPELTAWDDNTRSSVAKEVFVGTTNFPYCMLRGVITSSNVLPAAGAGTLPGAWGSQTGATATYTLEGDTSKQTAGSAIDAGKQFRFVTTLFFPDDISAGTTGHDPIYSVTYTYT